MWFGKPKSFLGIDLGKAGVKVVELKKEKNRPVLFTYGMTADGSMDTKDAGAPQAAGKGEYPPEEVESMARLLSTVCSKARVTTRTAVMSIPASQIFHALVTLPIAKKDDLNRMLEAEVKKLLPYALDQAQLDFQVVSRDDSAKAQRVLVSAVPRSVVSFYTSVAKAAGISIDALEPESIALSRSLMGRDTATALIVDIGETRTNFFIVDNTYPLTQQSIELGANRLSAIMQNELGVEADLTNQIKKDLFEQLLHGNPLMPREAFMNMFAPLIEPISKEIEYSIELYMRQSTSKSKMPEKIILTGGGSFFPYVAEYLTGMFKIKTYIGDPWGRVVYPQGLQPVLNSIAPRMGVAIGLALRNVV